MNGTFCYTGNRNAFLVKRAQSGGVQFSRDPFNLVNKHSRKYAGYANEKVYFHHIPTCPMDT